MPRLKHYPLFYFSGRRGIKSDRNWILAGMRRIPEDKQEEVATEYELIYCQNDHKSPYIDKYPSRREAANRYLKDMVDELGGAQPVTRVQPVEKPKIMRRENTTTYFDNFKQG